MIQETTSTDFPQQALSSSCRVTYVGHATIAIDLDGVRILTDPLLRDRVGHLSRQSLPAHPQDYEEIDAVLISHTHRDHLDLPSLRRLDNGPRMIVPHGAARVAARAELGPIQELRAGDVTTVGPIRVEAIHANHNGNRTPFGRPSAALGFVIHGNQRIYFAGDTHLFPEMASLARLKLDAALLPVWGWGPGLGNGHLDPRGAAEALSLIRPRVAIPIHWGTFQWMGGRRQPKHRLSAPPRLFARWAARLAPEVEVRILTPGEGVDLRGPATD